MREGHEVHSGQTLPDLYPDFRGIYRLLCCVTSDNTQEAGKPGQPRSYFWLPEFVCCTL